MNEINEVLDVANEKPAGRTHIPPWTAAILLAIGILLAHVVLPREISRRSVRHGWDGRRPGRWNSFGIPLVVAGLSGVIWGVTQHFVAAPGGWELSRTPRYMLDRGPYRFSRNPMYLFELVLWFGWMLFYGNVALLIALFVWWAIFVFAIVPLEERQLEERFGERYILYKNTVPRWVRTSRR